MAQENVETTIKELHSQAAELARKYVHDFAVLLLREAKNIALRRKDDLVLRSHVQEALETVTRNRGNSLRREISIIVGSAFFGAFVQGFASEVASGNVPLVVTYTVMGFVGLLLVFIGLWR